MNIVGTILRGAKLTYSYEKNSLYKKRGGYKQGIKDFNTLQLNNVKDFGVKYR